MKYTKKWSLKKSKLNFIFKLIIKLLKGRGSVLFAQGTHFITGPSGCGKTLCSNFIIRTLTARSGGFFWVNKDQYDLKITKPFDMFRLFENGEQKYRLPKIKNGHRALGIIFDEFNASFNRRNNRTTEYNEVFMPLIRSVVTHRHQGHQRIYILGQMRQDIQLNEIVQYKHEVFSSKRYRYFYFREKLVLISVPKKLTVISAVKIGNNPLGDPIYKDIGKTKIKVTIELLETYDTHSFASMFDNLPEY